MSHHHSDQEIEESLSKERQNLLEKLSTIFDPEIAQDYVCPKTYDSRHQLSLEELRQQSEAFKQCPPRLVVYTAARVRCHSMFCIVQRSPLSLPLFSFWFCFVSTHLSDLVAVDYNQSEATLRRLRSLEHYKSTRQSLAHPDLERSYQSFVRNQVAQQSPRHELERFVRNSSDIDAAKRYLDTASDALINPQQSLLLFRSSKLNEQKAHLLKSSGYYNPLQRLNEDPSIQKYFPGRLQPVDDAIREEDEHPQRESSATHSIHLAHHEKKYHVQFLKETSSPSPSLSSQTPKPFSFRFKDKGKSIPSESIFSVDTSTTAPIAAPKPRECFPPLSLSALKEYRPTFTPKPVSSPSKLVARRKSMRKADFIWPQSTLSSTSHE